MHVHARMSEVFKARLNKLSLCSRLMKRRGLISRYREKNLMHYYLILIAENNLGFTLRFDFIFFLLDFVFLLRTSAIFKQA